MEQHTIHTLLPPSNEAIANALEEVAGMLEERDANPHRVQAYLIAAEGVRAWNEPLAEQLASGGSEALQAVPGVGERLASRIAGFVETGQLSLTRQLRSEVSPAALFARVTGIGSELARRIHDTLGIETLEELEIAAHDGRLAEVEGFGPGRVRAVRAQLDAMLSRASRRRLRRDRPDAQSRPDRPSVETLLDVDRTYRERGAAGALRTITPRRFNPSGEAWLPILHTVERPWSFTALFSNTARAHELAKTDDWVVIYYDRGEGERQCTVVTEARGPLKGRRVVRGRERECQSYYSGRPEAARQDALEPA